MTSRINSRRLSPCILKISACDVMQDSSYGGCECVFYTPHCLKHVNRERFVTFERRHWCGYQRVAARVCVYLCVVLGRSSGEQFPKPHPTHTALTLAHLSLYGHTHGSAHDWCNGKENILIESTGGAGTPAQACTCSTLGTNVSSACIDAGWDHC